MSAYIVDPRTIDYLVQWAHHHASRDDGTDRLDGDALAKANESFAYAMRGTRLYPALMTTNDLGQLLLTENVRSVCFRYPQDSADDLPGPCDQRRVWRYDFKPIPHDLIRAGWVISSCDCLDYQSCETPDWRETLACKVLEAIRESAVRKLADGPWGVTDDDLAKVTA